MATVDSAYASLPKIQLHCHLEGTLLAETFVELTRRYGLSTRYSPSGPVDGPTDPSSVYDFADFREFLLIFAAVSRALASPDDYARLAREFVDDAQRQNVRYGEIFISPSVWSFFHRDLDLAATIRSIVAEFERARDAHFRLIVDVTRNFGADSAMKTARLAALLAGDGVIGIGLGGDESRFPAHLFEEVFAFARSEGLHVVAHAGEADGAHSVRDAVEILHAERIGHGIRALEDVRVVELLRERAVTLEVCPTSNFRTGVVTRDAIHPIAALDDAGVRITVDADDPTLFGTTITDEYAYVAQTLGDGALRRFIAHGIDAAFLEPSAKQALRETMGLEPREPVAKS